MQILLQDQKTVGLLWLSGDRVVNIALLPQEEVDVVDSAFEAAD